RRGPPPKPVAGWKPSHDCTLALPEGSLVINSSGPDPYLSYVLPKPLAAGRFDVQITMTSNGRGRGQFFWQEQGVQPPFFRDRSTGFAMTHDGKPHDYRIAFTAAHPVPAVRLDPGQAAGEIRISAMKLLDAGGGLVYEWRFAAASPAKRLE
ncbi:MAG: N-acetylgalactosamine 6-sulfate sulfatase (GALNS), partial [Planctomycetes bacterium]|nr:N-acetylgalactosamine 6-sulfate sulfatase (GALNS) [Planctomycetota bacterium]